MLTHFLPITQLYRLAVLLPELCDGFIRVEGQILRLVGHQSLFTLLALILIIAASITALHLLKLVG